MITFSNPRFRADFSDWPSGAHRVEHNERALFEALVKIIDMGFILRPDAAPLGVSQ